MRSMDTAMEGGEGWLQKWRLTAAVAGGNFVRRSSIAVMDNGGGGGSDR
jgi:hypothetical protein